LCSIYPTLDYIYANRNQTDKYSWLKIERQCLVTGAIVTIQSHAYTNSYQAKWTVIYNNTQSTNTSAIVLRHYSVYENASNAIHRRYQVIQSNKQKRDFVFIFIVRLVNRINVIVIRSIGDL